MRRTIPFTLSICLVAAACGSSSSQPDALDAELLSRAVAPPALVTVEPEADDGTQDTNAPADASGHKTSTRANVFTGTVDGLSLTPSYSFFMQGVMTVGDAQPTLVFVQTDAPNLCAHIAGGTMPKNATIFAAALVQTDGKPLQEHFSYTAPGHHGLDEDPRSIAFFRKLNGQCEISPDETGAQAMYGQAVIRKLVSKESVTVDYAFDFEEMGAITGHVEAPFCDAPAFFANPEQFYMAIEAENCKDL